MVVALYRGVICSIQVSSNQCSESAISLKPGAVTFSYTTAFWSWEDWELELDWLALRGINLPLAWVGYEYILVEAFREIGFSDAEITSFLSGPAFQAWNRFGNIQGSWDASLPMSWINGQFALQKKIVQRMVELGMTPVLPAFTGFVPRAIGSVVPDATFSNGSNWEAFPDALTNTTFLDPFDPLFAQLQKSIISKQVAAYGNVTHIYTLGRYTYHNYLIICLHLHTLQTSSMRTIRLREISHISTMSLMERGRV